MSKAVSVAQPRDTAEWQRYKVSKHGVSVLLPQMPTVYESLMNCHRLRYKNFYSFADGSLYVLTIWYEGEVLRFYDRSGSGGSMDCGAGIDRFDKRQFDERVASLRNSKLNYVETEAFVNGLRVLEFAKAPNTHWVVPKLEKKLWVELAILSRSGLKTSGRRFLESLKIDSGEGIEVGEGSDVMLGDPAMIRDASVTLPAKTGAVEDLIIVSAPRARYPVTYGPEYARESIVMRVEFLADGSIGKVEPLRKSALRWAKEATAAIRKIAFLPRRVDGVPVTHESMVTYVFDSWDRVGFPVFPDK